MKLLTICYNFRNVGYNLRYEAYNHIYKPCDNSHNFQSTPKYLCVCTVWIDVKLRLYIIWYYILIYGRGQRDLQLWPLPPKLHTGWSGKHTCFIVPLLGAFKTQLGGTYILSLLFYTVVVYCDLTYIYIYNFHRRLIRFPSNLHVTGFSSCRINIMIHSYLVWFLWWLRHGAIGPNEATPVGVNVDWIDFRINTF